MRRLRLIYAGREFTIPDAESADIRRRIEAALQGGDPWLAVVAGMGRGAHAHLLITPGAPIVLLDERADSEVEVRRPVLDALPEPGPDTID